MLLSPSLRLSLAISVYSHYFPVAQLQKIVMPADAVRVRNGEGKENAKSWLPDGLLESIMPISARRVREGEGKESIANYWRTDGFLEVVMSMSARRVRKGQGKERHAQSG